jgi:hypothetical protein
MADESAPSTPHDATDPRVEERRRLMGVLAAADKPLSELVSAAIEAALRFPDDRELLDLARSIGVAGAAKPAAAGKVLQRQTTQRFLDIPRLVTEVPKLMRRVCLVRCGTDTGTGFLIDDRHVLTNYHVIEKHRNDSALAQKASVVFDYQEADSGKVVRAGIAVKLDEGKPLVACDPYAPSDVGSGTQPPKADELDYALLRLARPIGAEPLSPEGTARGWILVPEEPYDFARDTGLIILQYPKGAKSLQSAIDADARGALTPEGMRVTYDLRTESGSSGAPVLNTDWKLVALHHAGDPDWKEVKYNQGIPIWLIAARLREKGWAPPADAQPTVGHAPHAPPRGGWPRRLARSFGVLSLWTRISMLGLAALVPIVVWRLLTTTTPPPPQITKGTVLNLPKGSSAHLVAGDCAAPISPEGDFALELAEACRGQPVVVKVDGYCDYAADKAAEPGPLSFDYDGRPTHVESQVVDKDGKPIAGVQIKITDTTSTQTDENGNFTIEVPCDKTPTYLTVKSSGRKLNVAFDARSAKVRVPASYCAFLTRETAIGPRSPELDKLACLDGPASADSCATLLAELRVGSLAVPPYRHHRSTRGDVHECRMSNQVVALPLVERLECSFGGAKQRDTATWSWELEPPGCDRASLVVRQVGQETVLRIETAGGIVTPPVRLCTPPPAACRTFHARARSTAGSWASGKGRLFTVTCSCNAGERSGRCSVVGSGGISVNAPCDESCPCQVGPFQVGTPPVAPP